VIERSGAGCGTQCDTEETQKQDATSRGHGLSQLLQADILSFFWGKEKEARNFDKLQAS
jgi:hypothetical protein